MLVSNLDHLNLSVQNFEETVHWYNKIFSFNLVEQGIQDGMPWGVIRCNDAMLCIYEAQDLFLPNKLEMKKKGFITSRILDCGSRIKNHGRIS